jgi:hypothetical protein
MKTHPSDGYMGRGKPAKKIAGLMSDILLWGSPFCKKTSFQGSPIGRESFHRKPKNILKNGKETER